MNIEENINLFLGGFYKNLGRKPEDRNYSFDYCYNYFHEFYENNIIANLANPQNLQISCLQIGFYLASWGMYRGSSFLLQKSLKYFERLIKFISGLNPIYWEIDVDSYDEENISLLINLYNSIRNSLGNAENHVTDTLVTKIMLGIFGNTPAYDENFTKGFGIKVFGRKTLYDIKNFYLSNKKTIDKIKIQTIDFFSGESTKRFYTKAKIIDMIGFVEGLKKGKNIK